jgi:hypothetical protein
MYVIADKTPPEGQGKRETIRSSKKDAVKALKAREGDVVRDQFALPGDKPRISFEDFYKEWCENHLKVHNTDNTYVTTKYRSEKHLVPVLGDYYLDEITERELSKLLAKKSKVLKLGSVF